METKIKKSAKNPKKEVIPQKMGPFTPNDLNQAVLDAFQKDEGEVDVRYLWSDNGVHRFRVNCWNDSTILYSEFVYVIEEDEGNLNVRRSDDK